MHIMYHIHSSRSLNPLLPRINTSVHCVTLAFDL